MCDAPCIFLYDCYYFTNICTIISLLYIPCLHVSTYSVIIRAFKIYQIWYILNALMMTE
jgi:hypothetical protein